MHDIHRGSGAEPPGFCKQGGAARAFQRRNAEVAVDCQKARLRKYFVSKRGWRDHGENIRGGQKVSLPGGLHHDEAYGAAVSIGFENPFRLHAVVAQILEEPGPLHVVSDRGNKRGRQAQGGCI